ncbi:hypothetical protein EVJ58_g8428 [Rhodofomes roseus]|uniref:Uncharacterized protein n=1 Tax=Rhodofomes roseus TaxID=34475 RepID=A0A4Y9XY20_9APHY|nr:hypothetical protein EVJ58_g8428 [Rhodofomes roseus]
MAPWRVAESRRFPAMQILSRVSHTPEEHAMLVAFRVVRSSSALVLSVPIALGSYVLCLLPSPHGEAYATANLDQTARIGWLGAGIIAGAVFIYVLFLSFANCVVFKRHIRLTIYAPPMKEILWGLFTRKGLFISLCFCAVQGMIGAAALEYGEDGRKRGIQTGRLDLVQAGLAGVVGSLLIQVVLDIIRRMMIGAVKAVAGTTNPRRVCNSEPRRKAQSS